jgi:hypothetical protein
MGCRADNAKRHAWRDRLARLETYRPMVLDFCTAEGTSTASFNLWVTVHRCHP